MTSSPQASQVEVTIEYLNTTAAPIVQALCSAVFKLIFLSIALPLFILVFAAYMVFAVNAWRDRSSGRISQAPIRYNKVGFSTLPLLARIEAVLTWNWYRPQREK